MFFLPRRWGRHRQDGSRFLNWWFPIACADRQQLAALWLFEAPQTSDQPERVATMDAGVTL